MLKNGLYPTFIIQHNFLFLRKVIQHINYAFKIYGGESVVLDSQVLKLGRLQWCLQYRQHVELRNSK